MMQTCQKICRRVLQAETRSAAITNSRCLTSTAGTVKIPEVVVNKSSPKVVAAEGSDQKDIKENCGTTTPDDELEELEEMFIMGPAGIEWNGPTRGGARPEPTRYKDWERKGRCTDF